MGVISHPQCSKLTFAPHDSLGGQLIAVANTDKHLDYPAAYATSTLSTGSLLRCCPPVQLPALAEGGDLGGPPTTAGRQAGRNQIAE